MILKGAQRGSAKQLAIHLLKDVENDHVEVYEVADFLSEDITGAFKEIQAVAKPGQIRKHCAVHVIEQRVRSGASGFDEVSAFGESYVKIVVDHLDQFPDDVVDIAKKRLADFDLAMPTDDRNELAKKTQALLSKPEMLAEAPAGNPAPKKELAVGTVYFRDPRVVAYTQQRANGVCELCQTQSPFRRPDGTPYLETHHILPLDEGRPDIVENCAAVCPNCHRALHSAEDKDGLAELLRTRLSNPA